MSRRLDRPRALQQHRQVAPRGALAAVLRRPCPATTTTKALRDATAALPPTLDDAVPAEPAKQEAAPGGDHLTGKPGSDWPRANGVGMAVSIVVLLIALATVFCAWRIRLAPADRAAPQRRRPLRRRARAAPAAPATAPSDAAPARRRSGHRRAAVPRPAHGRAAVLLDPTHRLMTDTLNDLLTGMGSAAAYLAVGLLVLVAGFVTVDLATPGNLRRQIWEDKNKDPTAVLASRPDRQHRDDRGRDPVLERRAGQGPGRRRRLRPARGDPDRAGVQGRRPADAGGPGRDGRPRRSSVRWITVVTHLAVGAIVAASIS